MVCFQWTKSSGHQMPLMIMPPTPPIPSFLQPPLMVSSGGTLLTTSVTSSMASPNFNQPPSPQPIMTSTLTTPIEPLSPVRNNDVILGERHGGGIMTSSAPDFSSSGNEMMSSPSSSSQDGGTSSPELPPSSMSDLPILPLLPPFFSQGTSKFHFNAHMNSHFEHRCPHCDYTSRTEGRLKRHIKDFHIDNGQPGSAQKTMRNNTPGRPKVYRCKQCEFVANTKVEFWVHARIHIKEEKVLQCPKCPFVTEYKHHLEYHLRNHFGSKPYKCNKCNYSCVNKSMLNSHMKSHTNVYQYRCADCTYATKYCHSLKLHLRKYNHKPATILNSDGSLPLDDNKAQTELMKNRDRGPRTIPRPQALKRLDMEGPHHMMGENGMVPRIPGMNGALVPPMYWPVLNNGIHQLPPPLMPVTNMVPVPGQLDRGLTRPSIPRELEQSPISSTSPYKCKLCCFDAEDKEHLNHHMLKVHAAENQDLFSAFGITSDSLGEDMTHRHNGDESHSRSPPEESEKGAALDLSKPMDLSKSPEPYSRKRRLLEHCLNAAQNEEQSEAKTNEDSAKPENPTPPRKRSRKGKAFKLDTSAQMQDEFNHVEQENEELRDEYEFSEENCREEVQKVPDFREAHESLRRLNQAFEPKSYHESNANRFVYSNDALKSPFQKLNALTNSIDSYKPAEKREDERREAEYMKPSAETPYHKPDSQRKLESPYPVKEPASYKPESPYLKPDSPRRDANGQLSENEDDGSSNSGRDASSPDASSVTNGGHDVNMAGKFFECQYCEIAFRDCVLYTCHMGLHGYKDAFHCNSCGYQAKDKVDFYLHIARIAHMH